MTGTWDPRWPPLDPGEPMRAMPRFDRVLIVSIQPSWVRCRRRERVVHFSMSPDDAQRVLDSLPLAIAQARTANDR